MGDPETFLGKYYSFSTNQTFPYSFATFCDPIDTWLRAFENCAQQLFGAPEKSRKDLVVAEKI